VVCAQAKAVGSLSGGWKMKLALGERLAGADRRAAERAGMAGALEAELA
jgi:hypothetical protein